MKNKKTVLAIIIAIDYELKQLNYEYKTIVIDNQTYYIINDEVVLMFCGIGKVNAGYKTALLIQNFQPQHIINLGSAGCTNPNIPILTINIANICQYGDVDVTCDPQYSINQIPYEPKYFLNDQNKLTWLTNLASKHNLAIVNKVACTVDAFVTKDNKHLFHELDNLDFGSVDMESCAIAQVCYHHHIPFNCIKIISDNIYMTNSHDAFKTNMKKVAEITQVLIITILESVFSSHHTSSTNY